MKKAMIYLLAICLLLMPLCSSSASAATDRTNTAEAGTSFVPSPAEVEAHGDLFYQYLLQYAKDDQDTARPSSVGSYAVGSGLTGTDKAVFLVLEEGVKSIAAGQRQTTVFSITPEALGYTQGFWTAEELGVDAVIEDDMLSEDAFLALQEMLVYDMNKIVSALLADHPYEMYWYNKTVGCYSDVAFSVALSFDEEYLIGFGEDTAITFIFDVADAYAGEDTYTIEGTSTILHTSVDPAKISGQNVSEAVGTARQIVADNASKTDYEKLIAYKDAICGMVSYNFDAAEQTETPYGDPWQMIYVFDGDESTNVVCEGYAKAFQYLCDLSEFSGEVQCYSVTGTMDGGTGEGPHMWNIVHMNDGKNYLADVTNCDEGSVGADDLLFLAGYASGSASEGYVYTCGADSISYVYDEYTKSVFDDSVLTLSETTYVEAAVAAGDCGEAVTWKLMENGLLTISGTGDMYYYSAAEIPWADHRDSIKTVVIESGVTDIGNDTFRNCRNLTNVTIPDSITQIGSRVFYNCAALESVTIPDSVTYILSLAFSGCSSLKSVSIPDSVESIGAWAFQNCASLAVVTLPEGITSIEQGVFSGCSSLKSVSIPDSVESIGQYAFQSCTSLESIPLPDSLTAIEKGAFVWCTSLTSLTIPGGVTSIAKDAFGNSGIKSIDIPAGITSIEEGAFYFCHDLAEITVSDDNAVYCSEDGVLFNKDKTTLIRYPAKKAGSSYTVPDTVTRIAEDAFEGCRGLTGIIIPDSVTDMGDYALYGCESMTGIRIPNGITRLGYSLLSNCRALTNVIVPVNVTTIGERAFANDSKLTRVTIPAGVAVIEEGAFVSCFKLAEVNYIGNETQWQAIEIGPSNDPLFNANINYNCLPVYMVVFDGSGGTGTMDPVEVAEGEELTLPENGFAAPAGTQFKAWQIGAAEYLPGSKYTVEADTTVTALWEDVPVMVAEPELDADAGTLSGTVCCDPSVEGQQAVFVVAFYDGKDRLIDMWSITVVLSDETPITIVGAPTDAEKVKLFILQDGTWVPYCASVVINT